MTELQNKVKQVANDTPFTEKDIALSVMSDTKKGLPINLQYFAEPDNNSDADSDNNLENSPEDNKPDENEDKKENFTRSDVDREVGKAVDKALKNRDAKHKEEMEQAIQDALAEKERLSKLSEKERKEEEMTKREKEIAEREAEIARKELRADAVSDLNEKGLPVEFADFLLADNAEDTLKNINDFKKTFDDAVNEKVKEALRQDTPSAGDGGTRKGTSSIAELRNKQDKQKNKAPDLWA
ncbi:MAG: DUF4355 domain-containing protein [Bacillota bacterium]